MRTRLSVVLTLSLLFVSFPVLALRFPDVSSKYPHREAIEKLSDAGVIGGNPDGTFRPTDPVNRAAMLKMLYIAAKIQPEKVGGCFGDVMIGSWYEFYVCDAYAKGFVKGYEGGIFKPGQPVTRAEALKLALVVFGIPDADLNAQVKMYTDVTAGDWFAGYVHTALAERILPIPGQDGSTSLTTGGDVFHPAQIMERGEAAAYIWNAMAAHSSVRMVSSSSSSESSLTPGDSAGASSAMTELEKRAAAALRVIEQERRALEHAQANTKSVTVPFTDKNTFDGKTPFSYEFSVTNSMTVDVQTAITEWNNGSLTCRLYHLGRSGFSQEYYLGFQDGKNCVIRAALSPGSWRLQLEPEKLAPMFSVSVKTTTGDGNDGFSQAATLPIGKARSDSLDTNDLEDWYTFTVPKNPAVAEDVGRQMVLTVSSADPVGCLIYPLDDVDQYGFKGPECGLRYVYPPGTYMASVRHGVPLSARETYSIQIK